jgi:hypothetical protein
MGKRGFILSTEDKEKAIAAGLSLQTVYARIKRGWDVEKAITVAPMATPLTELERTATGELLPKDSLPVGRPRTIYLNLIYDEYLDKEIEQSGLGQSRFIAKIIEDYLKKKYKL